MIDLYLCAERDADLVTALPMLRGTDLDGEPSWITSGPHHALDLDIPVETTPALVDEDGKVTTSAALDPRCHANLRLAEDHPARSVIEAAAAPYRTTPKTPRRVYA